MWIVKRYHWLPLLLLIVTASQAMVYDNRFIPLYPAPRLGVECTKSAFIISPMAATASKGFDNKQEDKGIGLPEIYGLLDLSDLAAGAEIVTGTNPLIPDKRGGQIPFHVDGKLQVQGVCLSLYHAITPHISLGGSMAFLRANSWHDFLITERPNVIVGQGETFEDDRERVFNALGLQPGHWKSSGFGDIDFYVRLGWGRGYVYKFRHIDAGVRFGVLIPTGQLRQENQPPSFSFGGDGHWGIYVALDALFEVKEDVKVGILGRINQRFSRRTVRRVPVKNEPSIFGAACLPTDVDPGVTVIFSPYVVFENLRDGLGGSIQFTLVSHQRDSWKPDRSCIQAIPLNVCHAEETSKWGSDYFTLNIFYDFGKMKPVRGLDPILSLRWDLPSKMLVVNRVAKTHRLSLGLELAF